MRLNYYTQDEIILCTYAALYDANDFGGIPIISGLTNRSISSIKMKIGNIAASLDEEGIQRHSQVRPLSGRPPGEGGRRTNWELIQPLSQRCRTEFRLHCREILEEEGLL